ncbi:unnamed protein product [Rotaria socialis]|uniref:EF-hand domain-containing protein n=1 Tax=Rotaria socialis TaxID=392032 RepID=A0A818JBH1_9BILA|nr:unnamed protein product [Rotaria socialis]CAF4560118.1 unnamed protein product [Rotaria socialis]
MNSNRSIKSNTSIGGRTSPSFPISKSDALTNRSSSPSSLVSNSRSLLFRQQDREKNEYPSKTLSKEDDAKFHKAVFIRCADTPKGDKITNREKFVQALNYVGYDLPKTAIDQIWSDNDEEIPLKIFQQILTEEKPMDERALEEAFETLYSKDRKHDLSAIDFDKFRTDLLHKGDRFTEDEFKKIRYLLGTEHGKVDVKKLIKAIAESKTSCRQKVLKEQEENIERPSQRHTSPKPNNKNYNNCNVRVMIDSSSKKPFNPPRMGSLKMKGAFFCEFSDSPTDVLYFSIGYSFELKTPGSISISLEPTISRYHKDSSFKNLDVRILVFKKQPRSIERRLLHMSSARSDTKTYLQVDELPKGLYEIIPITFGGLLRARSQEMNARLSIKKLREIKKGNNFTMSKDYRDALEYTFDLFDFDDNKQLDRQEYNLWTIRTTGDEITNEDWSSIQASVGLDVDENISKDKFLKLNDFEVQDQDTSEQDLWIGLKSIGFNSALELDMMCPFNLTVYNNQSGLKLTPTSFVDLAEIKKLLVPFLQKKAKTITLEDPSIHCFHYQDDCGSILFVENQGVSNVRLSIDVKNAANTSLNLSTDARKPTVISVRRDTNQIIWFAHKLDSQREMELDAIVQIE